MLHGPSVCLRRAGCRSGARLRAIAQRRREGRRRQRSSCWRRGGRRCFWSGCGRCLGVTKHRTLLAPWRSVASRHVRVAQGGANGAVLSGTVGAVRGAASPMRVERRDYSRARVASQQLRVVATVAVGGDARRRLPLHPAPALVEQLLRVRVQLHVQSVLLLDCLAALQGDAGKRASQVARGAADGWRSIVAACLGGEVEEPGGGVRMRVDAPSQLLLDIGGASHVHCHGMRCEREAALGIGCSRV